MDNSQTQDGEEPSRKQAGRAQVLRMPAKFDGKLLVRENRERLFHRFQQGASIRHLTKVFETTRDEAESIIREFSDRRQMVTPQKEAA